MSRASPKRHPVASEASRSGTEERIFAVLSSARWCVGKWIWRVKDVFWGGLEGIRMRFSLYVKGEACSRWCRSCFWCRQIIPPRDACGWMCKARLRGIHKTCLLETRTSRVLGIGLRTESRALRLCWKVTLLSVQKWFKKKNKASATKRLLQKTLLLASQSGAVAPALFLISEAKKAFLTPFSTWATSCFAASSFPFSHPLLSLFAVPERHEHPHPCAGTSPALLRTLTWKYDACLNEAWSTGVMLGLTLCEWNR